MGPTVVLHVHVSTRFENWDKRPIIDSDKEVSVDASMTKVNNGSTVKHAVACVVAPAFML